jgi:lysozyme family protein
MAKVEPKFHEVADEYAKLWSNISLNAAQANNIRNAAAKLKGLKDTFYTPVEAKTGVPWYVVGIIHSLESSFAPNKHLHNGDLLGAQTTREPAGRPKTPPFNDWAHSAVDALTGKGLHTVDKWTVERIAYTLERYNGWGYRWFHPEVKSPYLWSFTNQYSKGKYIADRTFDANAVSQQVGGMALLKQLVDEGLVVGQSGEVKPPDPPPPPVETGQFQVDATPFILRSAPDGEPTDNDRS